MRGKKKIRESEGRVSEDQWEDQEGKGRKWMDES